MGFRIQGSGFEVKVQGSGCRVESLGRDHSDEHKSMVIVQYEIRAYLVLVWGIRVVGWSLGFGVRGLGYRGWRLGFRVWGLGYRGWSLGSGVWGSGFGVCGLG